MSNNFKPFTLALLFATLGFSTQLFAQQSKPKITPQAALGPDEFDGYLLWQEAYKQILDSDIVLVDADKRAKFAAAWEHKHDSDGVLDKENNADKAIEEMIDSVELSQRFNFYNNPDDVDEEDEEVSSRYGGIGLATQLLGADIASPEHPVSIADEPSPKAPAGRAGLHSGDVILAVNDKTTNGQSLEALAKTLRGPAGSHVKLTVFRSVASGAPVTTDFDLIRAQIIVHPVHVVDQGNGITYVKVDNFESALLLQEWREALIHAAAGKALILDVRGNLGGNRAYVMTMLEHLISEGNLIEETSRKKNHLEHTRTVLFPECKIQMNLSGKALLSGHDVKPERREKLIVPTTMPIVILIDGESYSASEILAGALQANHRATVEGQPSGGKGVGQTEFELDYDRTIEVTSFEFAPGGVNNDWSGLIPDKEVKQGDKDVLDTHGRPASDTQLRTAIQDAQALVDRQAAIDLEKQKISVSRHQEFEQSLLPAKK